MDKLELTAKTRALLGKKVKTLRTEGILPAVIFGKGLDSMALEVDHKEFRKIFTESGETGLIKLAIGEDKKTHNVIVSEVNRHPVTGRAQHVNFREVSLKEKITAPIPVVIIGESPAVKSGAGMLLQLMNEIEVEALPQDLPHEFEIDISKLEHVDETICLKDVKIDREKVTILGEPEEMIIKLDYAEMEDEPEVEVSEEELIEGMEATKEKETDETGEEQSKDSPTEDTSDKDGE